MNMKKAIIIIASTAITLYTIKRKRKIMKMFYIIHTLLEKKKTRYPIVMRISCLLFFPIPLEDFLLLFPNVLSGIFTHILKGIYTNGYTTTIFLNDIGKQNQKVFGIEALHVHFAIKNN